MYRFVYKINPACLLNLALVDNKSLKSSDSSIETVLSLREDERAVAVEDLVRDFLGVTGQAVHKLPVLVSTALGGHLVGDLVAVELLETELGLLLLAHGDPGVGDQDVGVLDSLERVVGKFKDGAGLVASTADHLDNVQVDRVFAGGGSADVDTGLGAGNSQVVENVVGVTYPSKLEALEITKRFLDGHDVSDGLERVEQFTQCVDDWGCGGLSHAQKVGMGSNSSNNARGHGRDDSARVVQGFIDLGTC